MSRAYHVDVARHASGTEARWVENLLTRFAIPGVISAGQGASRRISNLGIYHVALVSRLVRTMGISLEAASTLAVRLLAAPAGEPIALLAELELRFDRMAFVASIDALIAEGAELTVPRHRGRPRRER
jgi:hypothetical protein